MLSRLALPRLSKPLLVFCLSTAVAATVREPMAFAQTAGAASVTGFVLDPDQAAIPGATVTLTPASGAAITTTSRADGAYTFRNVPAGTYSLTVTMQGFASFVKQGVRVANANVTQNAAMTVQAEATEINVTAQNQVAVSVDPDQNGSSVVIKDKDLEALSDDPDELADELSALAGPSAGPNGGQVYVDGFTGGQLPPKSSIREIRVNQNPFSAQFDKQGFGRVEVFTKPGTDKIHGQFSVQGNAKFLNTSNPFLGAANTQPDYHRIFFIGSLTGPMTKNSSYSLAGSHRTIQDNSIFAGQIISNPSAPSTLCSPGDTTCVLESYPASLLATFHPQTRYDFTPRLDFALGATNTLTVRYQLEHADAENAGLGSTSLSTTAYNTATHEQQLQVVDTQIISPKVINEARMALVRQVSSQTPHGFSPTLSVSGYFSGGGSSQGTQNSTLDRLELQNYTSVALKQHFIRAGMRLRVYREALFSTAGSNGAFSYQSAANYLANTPSQYKITTVNNPQAETHLTDVGVYAEDDFRIKSNLTLSYGFRYEAQGAINSKADIAPRVAISYGIPRKNGSPVTVLRGGWGIFYDRFLIADVIQPLQLNGTNQITQIYSAPTVNGVNAGLPGCSPTNTAACGTGAAASQTIYQLGPNLRSSYNMQMALGVDQQLGKRSTISFNYLNTTGIHQYESRSIPTGVGSNYVYQYQSGGFYRQNQFIVNMRTQISNKFSMFGFYALSYANGNTNGADSFPTDSLNSKTDYGRALFVQRNRVFLFGNWQAPFAFNFSPFLAMNTGNAYNVTTGVDNNGDTVINDRAGFANGVSGNCKVFTDFTTNVTDANRVPPGYCTGPPNVSFNLRAVKVFGFGKRNGAVAGQGNGGGGNRNGGGGGGNRGGGGGGRGPGGPGGFGGGVSSGHKYTFNVGVQIQNLFNFVPYSTPNASLSSPSLFGHSTSLTGGMGGPGGGGQGPGASSAVRSITLQTNFNF